MKKNILPWSLATLCLFGLLLVSSIGVAQVTVNTVIVNGAAPTSCTVTSINASGTLGAANYVFSSNAVTVTGLVIDVDIQYTSGLIILPAIVPFSQTITLGTLAPGTYTVNVNGVLNSSTNSTQTITMVVTSCCPAIPSFTSSDTGACEGETVNFTNTSTGAISYIWKDNGTQFSTAASPSLLFTGQANHDIELVVTDGTCSDSTSMTIVTHPDPVINLGADTSICAGDPLILNAGPGASYVWSDNNTTQTVSVSAVGTLTVTVTSVNGCVGQDDITILGVNSAPAIDLGPDTLICDGDSITLDAGAGAGNYLWSNFSTTQTVLAGPGLWICGVSNAGCLNLDTINIGAQAPVVVTLGNDTSVCGGHFLDAGTGFSSYTWSSGQTFQSIPVDVTGTYTVTVENSSGCEGSDMIAVTILDFPSLELGPDTSVCEGESYLIDVSTADIATYLWHDGSNSFSFNVSQGGAYWVALTGTNGCVSSDSVEVTYVVCSGIDELEDKSILNLFPNPSNGLLQINELSGFSGQLEVMEMNGKVVCSESVPESTLQMNLDLSELPKGMYLIQFKDADRTYIGKVLLQ